MLKKIFKIILWPIKKIFKLLKWIIKKIILIVIWPFKWLFRLFKKKKVLDYQKELNAVQMALKVAKNAKVDIIIDSGITENTTIKIFTKEYKEGKK